MAQMEPVLAKRTDILRTVWHLLGADGTPRCRCIHASVYKSKNWDVELLSKLPQKEFNNLCDRCAVSKNWVSPPGMGHLKKVLNQYVRSGNITGRADRIFTRFNNASKNWQKEAATQAQLDYLSNLGLTGIQMTQWSRGQASEAIDFFMEKKRELASALEQARFFAEDEHDNAHVVFENSIYKVMTDTDITVTYAASLSDYDIVESFSPRDISVTYFKRKQVEENGF